jgi:PII-like signaling protein
MNGPVKLLMIFVDENDVWGDVPLYEAVVRLLHHRDVAGATVLTGVMGFGSHMQVHRKRLFGIPDDRPVLILAADSESKLRDAAAELRTMAQGKLMLLTDAEAIGHSPVTAAGGLE